ncbi:hypothetical protein D3C84_1289190 [compost metagenome]
MTGQLTVTRLQWIDLPVVRQIALVHVRAHLLKQEIVRLELRSDAVKRAAGGRHQLREGV